MKIFTKFLLCLIVHSIWLTGFSQSGCPGNLLTNSSGYYGGFESGGSSISPTSAGSDLYNGLPRDGSYQIVRNVSELGGGGYLPITPKSGNYFLAAHTSNDESDRVWYANIQVVPGATYKFCTNMTLLKNLGDGAIYLLGLYVNGTSIAQGRVTFDWTELCGTYTVPAGVTSIELSIRDPKKGLFFVALDNICFSGPGAGKLRLGNQVWNDFDGDGKRDQGEPGIGNAPVSLYTDKNGDNQPDGPAIATTYTDEYGKYLFTNLAEGRYIESMPLLPGYSPSPNTSTQNTSPYPDNNVDNDNNLVHFDGEILWTNAITLNEGQEPTYDGDDANGNLTMDLGQCGNAWIGDFVWNDYNGNGIQDAGEPGINNVMVIITFNDGRTDTTITHFYANHDGYYDFKNLGPGTYKITFVTPNGYTPSPANQGGDDTKDSDAVNGSAMVTLQANISDFTIDAGFTNGTQPGLTLGNLVWNDKNLNGVIDAGEPGIAGAVVKLYKDDNNDNIADGSAIMTTTTDANGNYLFTNLTAGNYIVGVIIPTGNVRGPQSSIDPDNNVDNDNNGITLIGNNTAGGEIRTNAITLAPGTEPTNDGDGNNGNLTLDIALCEATVTPPTGTLSLGNLVWNDKNLNGVVDAGEPGIAGVVVKLYKDDNNDNLADGGAISTTTTDANGNYLFTNLTAGNYIVGVIIPSGNVRGPQSTIDPDNNVDNDNNGITLIGNNTAGGEIRSNAITLAEGTEPTNDGDGSNGNLTLDIALCEGTVTPPPPGGCPSTGTTTGGHTVVFNGVSYSGSGSSETSTFTYTVTSGYSPSISHFKFGTETCMDCFNDASDFAGTSGHSPSYGTDPHTNLCGIKFDQGVDGGNSLTVSYTLKGHFAVGTITFGVKAGLNVEYAPICGPVCQPTTTPPPPPTATCAGTSNSAGQYGGFEAGSNNFSIRTGQTDLSAGLTRNGSYEVVDNAQNATGGGYLNVAPHTGSNFMLIHTSSTASDRLWYKTVSVTPGQTYSFCAWVANSKADPAQGFTVNLTANNSVIATATAEFGWKEVCGSYTVPAGVYSIEFAVKDPNPGFGPSHFLALDDICISGTPAQTAYNRTMQAVMPVYPNPAGRNFKVTVNAERAGKAIVSIINMNGKVITSQGATVVKGTNSIAVNAIGDITGGAYNLQVMVDGKLHNQLLIISR